MKNLHFETFDLPPYVNVVIVGPSGFRSYKKLGHNSFRPEPISRILREGDTAINVYRWQKMAKGNKGKFIKQIKL